MRYCDFHTHSNRPDALVDMTLEEFVPAPAVSARSLSLHPWRLHPGDPGEKWFELAASPEVRAIGEIGLDKVCATPFSMQLAAFRRALAAAAELQKPLIIHCVRAYDEVLAELRRFGWSKPVVFHAFNRSPELLKRILGEGYWVSFTPAVLNRPGLFPAIAAHLSRIGLESDDLEVDMAEFYRRFAGALETTEEDIAGQLERNFTELVN